MDHSGDRPSIHRELIYDRADALSRIADDEDLFNELVGMFLADVPGYLSEIRQALDSLDLTQLQRSAHTLKGLLATFSAAPALRQALALEQSAKAGNAAQAQANLALVETELSRLLAALRQDCGLKP